MPELTRLKSSKFPVPFNPISNTEQDIFFITIKERLAHPTFKFNWLHTINFYAIIIITEGNYQHFLEFKTYDLAVGDLIIICPNQIHKFLQLDGFDGYIVAFTENFITHYLLNTNPSIQFDVLTKIHEHGKIRLPHISFQQITQLINILNEELKLKKDICQTLILQHLLTTIIVYVNREINALQGSITFDHYTTIVMQFKKLLQEEIRHTYDIEHYAQLLNINKRVLQLATKKITKLTPKELINNELTLRCKRELINPIYQMQDIAFNLGFADASTFTKFFKRMTNQTPLEFRKQMSNR